LPEKISYIYINGDNFKYGGVLKVWDVIFRRPDRIAR